MARKGRVRLSKKQLRASKAAAEEHAKALERAREALAAQRAALEARRKDLDSRVKLRVVKVSSEEEKQAAELRRLRADGRRMLAYSVEKAVTLAAVRRRKSGKSAAITNYGLHNEDMLQASRWQNVTLDENARPRGRGYFDDKRGIFVPDVKRQVRNPKTGEVESVPVTPLHERPSRTEPGGYVGDLPTVEGGVRYVRQGAGAAPGTDRPHFGEGSEDVVIEYPDGRREVEHGRPAGIPSDPLARFQGLNPKDAWDSWKGGGSVEEWVKGERVSRKRGSE